MKLLPYYALVLFLVGGAVWSGYIVEQIFLIMNVAVYLVFLFILWQQKSLTVSPLPMLILLFVLCYWAACFYGYDLESSILEASRVSSLLPLSLLATNMPKEMVHKLMKQWPWLGVFLVVVGLIFNLYRNGRLESTILYANSLAIILLMGILISLMVYASSKSKMSLVLVSINTAGLLLTFSRAVWVLWLVSVIVVILIFPVLRKLRSLVAVGAAHGAGLLIAIGIKQDWLFFLNRVSSINTGASEFRIRFVYWNDSLSMIKEHALGGTGGGGWTLLQHMYQSQDYFVKFIHNHYLQVLLDVGFIGGLLFMIMLVWGIVHLIGGFKHGDSETLLPTKGLLVLLGVLLLHAAFDFDLTYPLILFMLICILVVAANKEREIKLNRAALTVSSIGMVGIILVFGWLSVGYYLKDEALRYGQDRQYAEARVTFSQSARMIPWSHTVMYEAAKNEVLAGNDSGDSDHYDKALELLQNATKLIPEKELYVELFDEIGKYVKNDE